MVDFDPLRGSGLKLGAVDPMGGAGVKYWSAIAERYGIPLTISEEVDPTFRFMTVDRDGKIRMDSFLALGDACLGSSAWRTGSTSPGAIHGFCLEHVREYNNSYNFFAGMSDDAVAQVPEGRHHRSSAHLEDGLARRQTQQRTHARDFRPPGGPERPVRPVRRDRRRQRPPCAAGKRGP